MTQQRYTIIRELGAGGMGKVYLVHDKHRPDQEFALKALSLKDPDDNFLACFKSEFELLANLDHPHLAKVYDFANRSKWIEETQSKNANLKFAEGAQYFFTSEFVPGKNLFEATRDLDWKEICHLVIPLCRALEYINSRGIVHRDLKPGNILVSDVGKRSLKVLDFGLARGQGNRQEILEEINESSRSSIVGTLSFIAPELIRGEPIDTRADLYALGMILYRLFTRVSPFSGLNKRQIFVGHLEGIKTTPKQINTEIPRALNQLVMDLISPHPEDRPQHAGEVLAQIADLLGELTPSETVATSLGYVRSGKLVGREDILQTLHKRIQVLNEKDPKEGKDTNFPVVISGEAGLGKRKLLSEVQRYCQLQAIPFLGVDAHEDQRPMMTVQNILSGVVNILEEADLQSNYSSEIKSLKKWLNLEPHQRDIRSKGEFLDDPLEPLSPLRGALTREITRTFEVLSQYLERLTHILPGKMLVLHIPVVASPMDRSGNPALKTEETERSKLALFRHLGRALVDSPLRQRLFLILSTTPDISFDVLSDFDVLALTPLSKENTGLFLQSMLGTDQLPISLLELVYQNTSGNPLHIEEIMRVLVSEGHLERKDGKWQLSDTSPETLKRLAVPEEIQGTIGRRYDQLTATQKEILQAFSILSVPRQRSINAFHLGPILDWDLAKTLSHLEQCKGLGWLMVSGDYQYVFTSQSFAQVIEKRFYEADPVLFKKIHARVGRVLEENNGHAFFDVAYHFDQAQNYEKAIHYYYEGGLQAASQYAPQQALQIFQRACQLIAQFSENDRTEFFERQWLMNEQIARLLGITGNRDEALKKYEEILKQMEVLPKDQFPPLRLRSRVLRRFGHLYRSIGFPEKALNAYEMALDTLGPEASGREGALLLVTMAGVKGRMGLRPQSRRDCRFALKRIDAEKEPLIFATCYTVLGELELGRGQMDLAEEYFHRALKSFERIEDREGIALILSYLGSVLDRQGRNEEAELHLRRAVREAQAIGEVQRVAMARNNLGNLRFRRGDFAAATREYLAGVEAARRLGDRRLLATSLNNLGNVSRQRGEYGRSLEYYHESLQLKRELNDPRSLCHTLLALTELELQIGDYHRTNPRIQEALKIAQETSLTGLEAQALMNFGIQAFLAGERGISRRRFQEAREIYQKEESHYGQITVDLEEIRLKANERLEAKDFQKCTKILSYALEKAIPDLEAQVFLILAQGDISHEIAEAYYSLALQKSRTSDNQELEWEASYRFGLSLNQDKENARPGAGWKYIAQAKDILSEISSGLTSEMREVFLKHPLRKRCLSSQPPASSYDYKRSDKKLDGGDEEKTGIIVEDRLHKLLEINKRLNSLHHVNDLLNHILDTSLELLNGERSFLLLSGEGPIQVRRARHITKEELKDPEFEFSMSIAQEVISEGKPIVSMDAMTSPEFQESQSVHALKLRSVLCVPIKVRDLTQGALYIDNPKVRAMFTDEDAHLLMAFADQASLALEQARMREKLSEELEKTQTTLENSKVELEQARRTFSKEFRLGQMIGGKDPAMAALFNLLKKVAKGTSPVLILGESGTGKELVARAIHAEGPLKDQSFLTLNCAAFPEGLLESELFGHEVGAFTGANRQKAGLFEVADGGTIFLDEIGEMPHPMQAKLLRVLETGEVRRVGGEELIHINVRVLCATHRDLNQLIKEGRFRPDLMYRINTITLTLPPLRQRVQDFPYIVEYIMKGLRKKFRSHKVLSRKGMRFLEKYPWPGNVRELSNVLERSYTLAEGRSIRPDDLPEEVLTAKDEMSEISITDAGSLNEVQSTASKVFLEEALKRARGNVSRASRESGIPRGTFYRLMRRHGVDR